MDARYGEMVWRMGITLLHDASIDMLWMSFFAVPNIL